MTDKLELLGADTRTRRAATPTEMVEVTCELFIKVHGSQLKRSSGRLACGQRERQFRADDVIDRCPSSCLCKLHTSEADSV